MTPPRTAVSLARSVLNVSASTVEREFDLATGLPLPPHGRVSSDDQTPNELADPAGLVICPKTPRKARTSGFPSRDLVGMAAATLAATAGLPVWAGEEGPTWFVTISPGSVKIGTVNLGKGQRADELAVERHVKDIDMRAAHLAWFGVEEPLQVIREISGWSRKSRANMTRRLSTLDYNELAAAGDMVSVTLTYPGEWLSVAPNGEAVKRHIEAFKSRWARKYGVLRAVWKLEFQDRGAPHFHLLIARPHGESSHDFRLWIATSWAAVIKHSDPVQRANGLRVGTRVDAEEGRRMRDPRRIGVYFSKHGLFGAKDYQNNPPVEWAGSSIGRLWGYWGLAPAESSAPVFADQANDLARTLRRLNKQHRYLRAVTVQRVEQATGRIRYRTVRRPVQRMPGTRGYVVVNDGPSVAMLLDRVLAVGLAPAQQLSREQSRYATSKLRPGRLP